MIDNLLSWSHLESALAVTEALGVLAFTYSGLVVAARKGLDMVGMAMVAGITAFGGGTLRDILLDHRPFFWVEHRYWLWVLVALTLAFVLLLRNHGNFEQRTHAMQVPDALGLGLFAANGTQMALNQGEPAVVAVLMGMITAVFGGVLRDIVCNDIPSAFSDREAYALCALAGGWTLVGTLSLGLSATAALVLATVVTAGIRLLIVTTGFAMPKWERARRSAQP